MHIHELLLTYALPSHMHHQNRHFPLHQVDRLVTNWGWGGNNDETITNLSPKLNNFHLLNNNNNNNHDMNTIVSSNDYNINNNNNNNNTNNFYKFDEYNNGRVENDNDDDFDDDFKNSYANSMQLNKPSFISNSARRSPFRIFLYFYNL